jgi:hypothetical protein
VEGRQQHSRVWVAVLAAYALAVQALLASLAIGASAAPLSLDSPDIIICTGHSAETLPGKGDPTQSGHVPDCCTIGCSMFWHAVLSAPGATSGPVRLVRPTDPPFRLWPEPHSARREGTPGNPRAPPLGA